MSTTSGVPAGWYPDPANPGGQRFWDGNAWTHDVSGPPAQAAAVAPVAVAEAAYAPAVTQAAAAYAPAETAYAPAEAAYQPAAAVQTAYQPVAEQVPAYVTDPYAAEAAAAAAAAAAVQQQQAVGGRAPAWEAMDTTTVVAPAGAAVVATAGVAAAVGSAPKLHAAARRVEGIFNFFALLVIVLAVLAIAGAWFYAFGTSSVSEDGRFAFALTYTVVALLYAAISWAFLKAGAVVMGYVGLRSGGHE